MRVDWLKLPPSSMHISASCLHRNRRVRTKLGYSVSTRNVTDLSYATVYVFYDTISDIGILSLLIIHSVLLLTPRGRWLRGEVAAKYVI